MSLCNSILCLWAAGGALFAAEPSATPPPTKGFTVTVLQGDGVLNPLPRPPATHVSIRVADAKGQPVRNAVAAFELPEAGASAAFADGSAVKVLLTNEKGEATVDTKSNEVPGKYQATVTVNYLGQSSVVKLNQENTYPYGPPARSIRSLKPRGFLRKKTVLIVAAVAATAVIAIALHGGSSKTTTSPTGGITITPGTGTVGGN
jgi:hypothetical protein